MKTIATIAVSLLLSLGLLVSPASAEEAAPAPTCDPAAYAALHEENWELRKQVALLQSDLASSNALAQDTATRWHAAERRANRLHVEKVTLQHKLFALRGKVQALRQKR